MSRTRGAVTLAVLAAMFVGGIAVGFQLLTSPIPDLQLQNDSSEPTCKKTTLPAGSKLSREQVTVDVFNDGSISGLASKTMRQLARHGFQRGLTGNADDLDVRARNVTLITGDTNGAYARLLSKQFRGKVRVREGETSEPTSISVVVGDGFVGVDQKTRKRVRVREKLDVCVPIESTTGND